MKTILCVLTVLIAALSPVSPLFAFEAGVVPSTVKVLPGNPLPDAKAISIESAANEWEGFQIVIKSAAGESNVNVVMSDLTGPGGAVIPASGFRLYREHYLDIKTASPFSVELHERVAGLYPDPLIPLRDPYKAGNVPVGAPFNIEAGGTAAVYIDLFIPKGAVHGNYTGAATVTADGKAGISIPVSAVVWEFEIPSERSVGTAFGFGDSHVRKYHGGPAGPDPAGFEEIKQRYHLALHEHRMDETDIGGSVEFKFDKDGNLLPIDWTAYDAEVGPWLDGTKFGDGIPVNRFNVDHFSPGHGKGSMSDDQWARAAAAFAEHLNSKGWWDRAYVYALDEPWLNGGDKAYEQIKYDCELLEKYTTLWKGHVLITGWFDARIAGHVGIWCPVTPMYESWFYNDEPKPGRSVYDDRRALGEELWFYVCNANFPPYAGYDIDTAVGHEPRIVKWGTWYERATGFLFWRVSYWINDDPWNIYANYDQFGPGGSRNGDGFLFYPGDHNGTMSPKGAPEGVSMDGPVLSYRMKQIRDGFEDWEMFNLASRLGGEEYTRAQVARAYTRFGDFSMSDCTVQGFYCPKRQPWTLKNEIMADVRRNVAAKILYLKYPDRYPDPEKAGADAGMPDSGTDAGAHSDGSADGGEGGSGGCSCSSVSI
jgi:hypothetical protein